MKQRPSIWRVRSSEAVRRFDEFPEVDTIPVSALTVETVSQMSDEAISYLAFSTLFTHLRDVWTPQVRALLQAEADRRGRPAPTAPGYRPSTRELELIASGVLR